MYLCSEIYKTQIAMRKFFLALALAAGSALSVNAQNISMYLHSIKELNSDVRRSQLTLTLINSAGQIMSCGELCTLRELPALLEADMAKKDPCYMAIITDVPVGNATFQAVAKQYLATATKLKKKPIKIYYGSRQELGITTPPPPPAPDITAGEELVVIEDEVETESIEIEEDDSDDAIYKVVEKMPEFPGGSQAMFKYLAENIQYPAIAKENNIQGRVVCSFTVNKDGSLSNIEVVLSGGDASLDKEAVRVIKSMPKWKPGTQLGKPVRVQYTIPVKFQL